MKRIFAVAVLAVLLTLSVSAVAFAIDVETEEEAHTRMYMHKVREARLEGRMSMTTVEFVPPTVDIYEPNDGMKAATEVTYGDTVHALIDPDNDIDFYRFYAKKDDNIFVGVDAAKNGSLLNARLVLYDHSSHQIETNYDWNGNDPLITIVASYSGMFFIEVRREWYYGGGEGHFYSLILQNKYVPVGTMTGTVTDGDGNPLSGVWVEVSRIESVYGGITFTGDDGNFTLNLPAGKYEVSAEKYGHVYKHFDNELRSWDAEPVEISPPDTISGIDFSLPVGAVISGTITDAHGNPLANMNVDIYNVQQDFWSWGGESNSDGSYIVPGLPTGTFLVQTGSYWQGYMSTFYNGKFEWNEADPMAVTAPDTTFGIDFTLYKEGTKFVDVRVGDTAAAPEDKVLIPIMIGGDTCEEEPEPPIIIDPPIIIEPGDPIIVEPIIIWPDDKEEEEQPILSAQMTVIYDGDILIPVGQTTDGSLIGEAGWQLECGFIQGASGEPDTMTIAAAGSTPLGKCGTLLHGRFEVDSSAVPGTKTPVRILEAMLNEGLPPTNTEDGEFFVKEPPLCGDVSLNGEVTAYDGSLVLQYVVGMIDPSQYPGLRIRVADVTGDSTVSALDASYILRYVAGLIPELPFPPPGGGGSGGGGGSSKAIASRVWLGIPEPSTTGFRVPIWADDLTGILAGELLVSSANVKVSSSDLTQDFLFASHRTGDVTKIAFAGAKAPHGTGIIAYLEVADVTGLRLEHAVLNDIPIHISQGVDSPQAFGLSQNYPNPFNPQTTIRYELPADSKVTLTIYTVTGQRVATLVDKSQPAGRHEVVWDASDFANGVYFFRLNASEFVETRKMLLAK